MERNFVVCIEESIDVNRYLSYVHKCYLEDEEVRKSEEYDNIGDCLIDFYEFERKVYDDFHIDTRSDSLRIRVDVEV